ncbi:L,D-transpeptidase [Aurantimonas sp. Leaf443]|uniref:L,D-transpeptidase n=1 Tax=Aurantimonas sp. Leaf443 TaxID=1736378 RepID=UPI0007003973|nr:L,D-transpeptidase [Aurantimonas sp. Leaf443]KQT87955.1 hypothetical protein ASG48_00360 [Aurantimonas sp. Leaf443]
MRFTKTAGLAIAALLASLGGTTSGTLAQARYGTLPPVEVSPGLQAEWTLQLSPGSGAARADARPQRVAGQVIAQPMMRVDRRSGGGRPSYVPLMGQGTVVQQPQRLQQQQRIVPGMSAGYVVGGPRQAVRAPRAVSPQREIDPVFLPQDVPYDGKPGTIVIDTRAKFLYHVGKNGMARRYGVGVGKPGFAWKGSHAITRKAEWPSWTPPAQMRARERAKGRILPVRMDGGEANPLGARALYLGSTLYRIHGTNQPWTIGSAVSSGCIRMRNEDVTDLYERVKVGTRVTVR